MEIQRHNIFELIGGKQNLFHSAILTSYTFDPIFFESFYLPRLRQCGVSNVVVLLDSSNYDQALLQYPSFGIQSDRRQYTLIRQTPTNNGVFHPKISMLFGEDAGMLIVGSGNLTYNGHAINEEVWNTFSLKGPDSVYHPLFSGAWKYLNALKLPDSILLKQQLKWMKDNVKWLREDDEANNVTVDNEKFIFLANDADGTILSKLQAMVDNEKVDSITTISPFYDTTGLTIKELHEVFKPRDIKCIYTESGIYPYDLMKDKPDWLALYSWDDVFVSKRSDVHKLHAKIIQLTLPSHTILVSGSANVTNAAFNGAGDEVCIAIISEQPKDYIKNLGITLNQQLTVSPSRLEGLIKPERTLSASIAKKVQIISAEVVDDILSVITNKPVVGKFRLRILDTKGDVLQEYDITGNDEKLQIKPFRLADSIAVIIDSDNTEVSNRCFIINDDDVARFNPNKTLRKLDSLLESNKDWKDNLEGILSYVWFDDDSKAKTVNLKGASSTTKKEKEVAGREVSSEDFDNIRVGHRQAVLSMPDVRIIDFLLSSDKKKEVDLSDTSDDPDAIADVDAGDNEYHNSEHSIEKHKQEKAFIDCIDKYSQKLREKYNTRLSDLYSTAAHYGGDIFKSDFTEKTQYVSVADYSRILIDIVLMWKELEDSPDRWHGNMKQDFIRNLGKFLLLARKGYPQTNDYAWHKCIEFQNELIVFSLLIIASQNWRADDVVAIKLLVANLLVSCSKAESVGMDEVIGLFEKKIAETKVAIKPKSMALISKTISEYKEFSRYIGRNDSPMIRVVDFDLPQGNYAYKSGYGFFYVTDMRTFRQPEMSLYHPGFDEIVKVVGLTKILALS